MTRFRAKISESNAASLALFAKLGYEHKNRSAVFQEITLELGKGNEGWAPLLAAGAALALGSYDVGSAGSESEGAPAAAAAAAV